MNKVLGLTAKDIADLEGTTRKIVAPKIRLCYERLITMNISFFEPEPDEINQAQVRIEKKRARERKLKRTV
jgi:hypothetical protein